MSIRKEENTSLRKWANCPDGHTAIVSPPNAWEIDRKGERKCDLCKKPLILSEKPFILDEL